MGNCSAATPTTLLRMSALHPFPSLYNPSACWPISFSFAHHPQLLVILAVLRFLLLFLIMFPLLSVCFPFVLPFWASRSSSVPSPFNLQLDSPLHLPTFPFILSYRLPIESPHVFPLILTLRLTFSPCKPPFRTFRFLQLSSLPWFSPPCFMFQKWFVIFVYWCEYR